MEVFKNIYNSGIWSEDFTKAVMVTLAKKQNASNCGALLYNKPTYTCIKNYD